MGKEIALTGTSRLLLSYMANHAAPGGTITVRVADLAAAIGTDRRNCQRRLRYLEAIGRLEPIKRSRGGQHVANAWRVVPNGTAPALECRA